MYVYDITRNHITEMTGAELSAITGKDHSSISRAKKVKSIIQPFNIVLFDVEPNLQEKKTYYEKLILTGEAWMFVEGSDHQFKISNYGRFKRIYKSKEVVLLPYLRKQCGNMHIKVKFNGIYKQYRVKDLVAAHFLRKPRANEVLYHSNGIKTDDFAGNLQWIDRKKLGTKTGGKSKSKAVVKVNTETMEIVDEWRSTREAARNTPYSYQSISNYCNKVVKNMYGDVFMWLEDYESNAQ